MTLTTNGVSKDARMCFVLGDDLVNLIVSNAMDGGSLLLMSEVCKPWYLVANRNEHWFRILAKRFPKIITLASIHTIRLGKAINLRQYDAKQNFKYNYELENPHKSSLSDFLFTFEVYVNGCVVHTLTDSWPVNDISFPMDIINGSDDFTMRCSISRFSGGVVKTAELPFERDNELIETEEIHLPHGEIISLYVILEPPFELKSSRIIEVDLDDHQPGGYYHRFITENDDPAVIARVLSLCEKILPY